MRIPTFISLPSDAATTPERPPVLLRGIAAFLAVLAAWRQERRTLALIAQMDAATLKDIGADRWSLANHVRAAHDKRDVFMRAWYGA